MHRKPYVSIIVPVYNDSRRLERCLHALSVQSYPKRLSEIIVVDNGSEISPESLVRKYGFSMLTESKPGSYAARNRGVLHSGGEIIGFTDSDCIPDRNWISNAVREFAKDHEADAVAGKIEVYCEEGKKRSALEIYDRINHFNQRKFVEVLHFSATANLFCKRRIFAEAGLFDDYLFSFGDVEFGQRLSKKGFKLRYAPRIVVDHPSIKNYQRALESFKTSSWRQSPAKVDSGKPPDGRTLYSFLFSCRNPRFHVEKVLQPGDIGY